jgi:hypothetical protein
MNCHEAEAAILNALDQTPASPGNTTLSQHLAVCERCRDFAARQRELDAALTHRLSTPALPPGFRERVLNAIATIPAPAAEPAAQDQRRQAETELAALLAGMSRQWLKQELRLLLDALGAGSALVAVYLVVQGPWVQWLKAVPALPWEIPPSLAAGCLAAAALIAASFHLTKQRLHGSVA